MSMSADTPNAAPVRHTFGRAHLEHPSQPLAQQPGLAQAPAAAAAAKPVAQEAQQVALDQIVRSVGEW